MTDKPMISPLPASALYRASDLGGLEFADTRELRGPGGATLGQERAVEAIRFGINMADGSYNIFVLGPPGSNRHELVESIVRAQAETELQPPDWCYVNNFSDPQKPQALRFGAGQGARFRDDMRALIEELQLAIPAAFEDEDYRKQLKAIEQDTKRRVEAEWNRFQESAQREDIGILQTPGGYVLVPSREGRALSDDEFNALPEEERARVEGKIERLSKELQTHIEQLPKIRRDYRERVKTLDRDVITSAVGLLLHEIKQRYQDVPAAVAYLDEVQRDIVNSAQDFRRQEAPALPFMRQSQEPSLSRYEVNLLVDHSSGEGAPVVYEPSPSYPSIIGKIEHHAELGALVTDFRLIRSGALHRASGGYLILDAWRVLTRPFLWEALKRALQGGSVRIESPGEAYGLLSTTALQPEPIPIQVKVILIGERLLYYLMALYDSEFDALFRVAADVEDDLERTDDSTRACAMLIAELVRDQSLRPFDRDAVERVIEQRARDAGDNERLSTHMQSLIDLLKQADYWAGRRNARVVGGEDVRQAIAARIRRADRAQRRLLDAIQRDVLLIDTSGEAIGQINGLSVVQLGEHRFGHPVRITATTRIGTGEVVDIEREVKLGGAVHSKGMLILSSALAARYAADQPLSLAASVVFEQSYGGVEGDSASVAELCALLSSLSHTPIRQNLSVTGSVNQHGRVQVIGGINEKIEGFFDVCRARGLDGTHGVIMPHENVKHLMLRDDVVEAVAAGKFHVYPIKAIDQALTLLTGVDAGQRDADGKFPDGSVNHRVEKQLLDYAGARRAFAQETNKDD